MTSVLKVDPLKITFEGINLRKTPSKTFESLRIASDLLHNNEVVAFPTETVYGLGANCQSTEAVHKIYQAKNRPADNPLIIHVASRQQIETTLRTQVPRVYDRLIQKFWPGPLTILLPLPANTPISPLCTKGQQTFGCRMPSHPVARALISLSQLPLAAPSANSSTKPSGTEAKHVVEDMYGRIPLVLDGGSADVGVESTVVDGLVSPPRILRPGGVSLEEIREFGGPEWKDVVSEVSVSVPEGVQVRAPGMKYRHYSPQARVVLVDADCDLTQLAATYADARKVAILTTQKLSASDFTQIWPADRILDLPLGRTKKEVSHNLFSRFRDADEAEADVIVVETVDLEDEGMAIMNRLKKAGELHLTRN